jgi:hypothetical protein
LDVVAKQLPFLLGRPTRTDDADGVLVIARGVHDKDQASFDRPGRDESVFLVGMGLVEELKIVVSAAEQGLSFFERDACFFWFETFLASFQTTFTAKP